MSAWPDIVYLAQAIDQADPQVADQVEQFAKAFKSAVTARGVAVYSPAGAWSLYPEVVGAPELVEHVNREALAKAHVLVAVVYPGMRSFGLPMEIEQATNLRKPVEVVNVSDDVYHLGVSLRALVIRGNVTFFQDAQRFLDGGSLCLKK